MLKALCFMLFSVCVFAVPPAKVQVTPLMEAQALWDKRDEEQSLSQALAKYEEILTKEPTNFEALTNLVHGNFLLGEFFREKEGDKKDLFEKARAYGERALATNPEYKSEKDLPKLTLREIEPLYWTAASLGKWAKANGIFSSLKYKDQILSMIRKVEELKPDFNYGSVPRYWGSFYAVAPGIAGGDMKKSKENFQKALSMAPESLATKVLFAELYWTKKDDKDEFKKLLGEVIAAPEGPKDVAPENRLEKKKAQRMLDHIGDYF